MGFEQPSFKSDDEKAISRREFLKKAALTGGALIAGAAGMKLATDNGLIGEKKEKVEKISEGTILEKNHVTGLTYPSVVGKVVVANKFPDQHIFKINVDNEIINVNVSKEQFDQHNVNDNVSIKYEIGNNGEIKSPKLLDANKE